MIVSWDNTDRWSQIALYVLILCRAYFDLKRVSQFVISVGWYPFHMFYQQFEYSITAWLMREVHEFLTSTAKRSWAPVQYVQATHLRTQVNFEWDGNDCAASVPIIKKLSMELEPVRK